MPSLQAHLVLLSARLPGRVRWSLPKALAAFSGALVLGAGAQTVTPIATTGYNFDAVAESTTATASTTTTAPLDGSDYVLFSQAYSAARGVPSLGLPDSGLLVHGANSYQLQPYTGFNALRVAAAATGTLTLATPTTLATARLIGFATEGTQTVNLQLNFQDGSFASYNGVTLRDWFNGASAVASGFGRAGRTGDVITNPAGNPRIYSLEMAVACTDQTKPITSIAITSTASAGHSSTQRIQKSHFS